MNVMDYVTRRNFLVFSALVSLSSLSVAYVAQYFFEINPCILCLYERYFYWGICITGLIGYFSWSNLMFKLSGLILLGGCALGLYHLGVELHWWQGTAACQGTAATKATSIEDLRIMLKAKPMARCDQANWHIMGLSATYINLAWFVGFLGAWIISDRQRVR